MGGSEKVDFLYSECCECGQRRGFDEEQVIPCPECGCSEVDNVWSDGQHSDAYDDAIGAAP